jgi:hypothetical protein
MSRYSGLLAAALVGLLVFVGLGLAQESPRYGMYYGDMAYGCGMMGGGMMGGGMMGGMLCGMMDDYDWEAVADDLNLSQEQRDQLMEQNRNTVRDMLADRNELSMKMFDLNSELKSAEPDQAKVDKLVDDVSSMQKKILQGRIAAIGRMRQMLTHDQWNSFMHMNMTRYGNYDYMPMMERGRGMRMMR